MTYCEACMAGRAHSAAEDTGCPRPRLLPASWPLIDAYLRCGTQWTHGALGERLGLSYPGVESALRLGFPKATPRRLARLFEGVQAIERAALGAHREVRQQAGAGHDQ